MAAAAVAVCLKDFYSVLVKKCYEFEKLSKEEFRKVEAVSDSGLCFEAIFDRR